MQSQKDLEGDFMKSDLIKLLETFGFPVFQQGSMNDDDDYPSSFFTFWNFESPEDKYYDNEAVRAVWGFWVYFYSDDPALIDVKLEEARKLLKQNGWIINGKGEDANSDEKTHTGRMITCYKIENY